MQQVRLSCLKCRNVSRLPISPLRPLLIRHFRILTVLPRSNSLVKNCFVRNLADSTSEKEKKRSRSFFSKKKGKVTNKTFYDVLGVAPGARHEDIRSRYLELAKLHHPDSGGSPQEFAEISSAFKVLGDKKQRAEYDARLEYNPDGMDDAAGYTAEPIDWSVKVIMRSGMLKLGPWPLNLPRRVLIPLVWMGAEQMDGDSPVYRKFYRLGIMWTLFILIVLRQIYITLRDWRPYQESDRPWLRLNQEERSRFAWRALGMGIALAALPLCYRRWDLASKLVKDTEERVADGMVRVFPRILFWTLGWTFGFGPIVGSGTEFMYSHLNRKDLAWDSSVMDSAEANASRTLQILCASANAALCVQRAQAKGVPLKFGGRAAILGWVTGRVFGWLCSFTLVGNTRRHSLKQPTPTLPVPTATTPPVVDQLAQLQQEVEQLRQAVQQKQAKVDNS